MKNASLVYPLTSGLRKSLLNDVFTVRGDLFDLDLNFANGSVPSALFAVSRASNRVITNSAGLIETVGNNDWGIYHDANGNPLGLVVEAASTNVITASEAFDGGGAPWVSNNVVITANNAVAPDGATTAELVQNNASNAGHLIYIGSPGLTPVAAFTYSKFFKRDDHDWVALRIDDSGGASYAHFNLNTGAVGTADAGVTARIEAYANGWYRCSASKAANGGITFINTYLVSADNGKNAAYVGTGTGVWMWGAMLEERPFATSYIKTEGSATTRAQDVPLISDLSSFYNFSQGTFLVEATIPYLTTPVGVYFAIGDGVATDYMAVAVRTDVDNSLRGLVVDSGVIQADITDGTPIVAGTTKKIAFAYALNDFVMYEDGTSRGTGAAGTPLTAVDRLAIGTFDGGSLPLNGWIKRLRYSKTRLSNDNIAGLTS
jgi:hypothetical protein